MTNTITIAQLQIKAEALKKEIKQLKASNESYRKKLKSAEKSYDSILEFREKLQALQSSFSSMNTRKSVILQEVQAVSKNSIVAQKYYEGMNRLLKGIGSSIASKMLNMLSEKSTTEKENLGKKITDYNGKIDYNKKLIKNKQEEYQITVNEIERLKKGGA